MESDEEPFLTQNSFFHQFFSQEFNFRRYLWRPMLVGKREDTVAVDNACWANGKERQKRH